MHSPASLPQDRCRQWTPLCQIVGPVCWHARERAARRAYRRNLRRGRVGERLLWLAQAVCHGYGCTGRDRGW